MADVNIPIQVNSGSFSVSEFNQFREALQIGSRSQITSGLQVLNGAQFNKGAYFDGVVANAAGVSGVDWTAGNKQSLLPTGAMTLVYTAPTGPTNVVLEINWGGSGTVAFPSTSFWGSGTEPTWTATSGATDLLTAYYNGTNYIGGAILDVRNS